MQFDRHEYKLDMRPPKKQHQLSKGLNSTTNTPIHLYGDNYLYFKKYILLYFVKYN